jgi:hypothetical protein
MIMPNPRIEPLKKVLAMDPHDDVAWFGLGKDECRTVCATGIEVSTKNGDAMVTKNLEALKLALGS